MPRPLQSSSDCVPVGCKGRLMDGSQARPPSRFVPLVDVWPDCLCGCGPRPRPAGRLASPVGLAWLPSGHGHLMAVSRTRPPSHSEVLEPVVASLALARLLVSLRSPARKLPALCFDSSLRPYLALPPGHPLKGYRWRAFQVADAWLLSRALDRPNAPARCRCMGCHLSRITLTPALALINWSGLVW